MRKEYELQTDVLATIVATTPVKKKHADLLTTFATRTDYRSVRYVMMRDTYSPAWLESLMPRAVKFRQTIERGLRRNCKRMAARHA
jgi:hypothetical protein